MAIQQHPLPQDISSYRFRLIGDMTIKQFASLGISIVLALITYSLPLPFFFRYPLSFTLLCLGVGMAFIPVQGRSLDVWILAFIKSIYSPTQYSWKRTVEVPTDTSSAPIPPQTTISKNEPSVNPTPVSVSVTNPTPPAVTSTSSEPIPQTPSPVDMSSSNIEPAPDKTTPSQVTPTTEPVKSVPIASDSTMSVQTPTPEPQQISPPTRPQTTIASPKETPPDHSSESQLPIPFTPSTPNTLVGLTLTPEGKILDGVLVEIQQNGLTSRATKSNKLGQFMFARPLENGTYQITAEKDGYRFTPYSLELSGQIVRPLKVQAL